MKTCSTRLKRLDGNLNIFKTVDCSLSEMSVNRKGEKLNFELAPAVSYKSGLEIGEKTCQQGISDLYYYCCCCCYYYYYRLKHEFLYECCFSGPEVNLIKLLQV